MKYNTDKRDKALVQRALEKVTSDFKNASVQCSVGKENVVAIVVVPRNGGAAKSNLYRYNIENNTDSAYLKDLYIPPEEAKNNAQE